MNAAAETAAFDGPLRARLERHIREATRAQNAKHAAAVGQAWASPLRRIKAECTPTSPFYGQPLAVAQHFREAAKQAWVAANTKRRLAMLPKWLWLGLGVAGFRALPLLRAGRPSTP